MEQAITIIIVAVFATLWRLGGSVQKAWRRFGVAIGLGLVSLLRDPAWYWALIAVVAYSAFFHMPFTIIGDDISDSPIINWGWLILWGYILASPGFLIVGLEYFPTWAAAGTVISGFAFLSNIKPTRDIFVWDGCEFMFGAILSLTLL